MPPDAIAPAKPARLHWIAAAFLCLCRIVQSLFTGPDGTSWAPGRVFAFATFAVAQGLVVRVSGALLPLLHNASDWMTFFAAVAGFQGATGATCIALVLGIAPADSGGRWWSKDASPPPKI